MVGRTIAVIAAGAILLATTGWAMQRAPEPPPSQWPAPEEIDSLSRYLAASEPAPSIDDYAVFLPAEAAPLVWSPPVTVSEPERLTELRLSAILIAGNRPLAIINDRHARPGETLDGGAVVVSITRDRVVVRERSGTIRTLRLPNGSE